MKKLTGLFMLLLVLGSNSTRAQNEALDSINLQLRQLFSPLSKPTNPKWFLYDMAAHVSDSVFYQNNCPDTNNTEVWFRVYEEMYHSAYDTTALVHPTIVQENALSFANDTIPIGIMHYSFYTLKPEALTTNTYFNFDTVNTVLTDKNPRPGYPYNEGTIFIAAPLLNASRYANPIFRIDPAFIFYDSFNDPGQHSMQLKIDFDDGNGWVPFDHTVTTFHQVSYNNTDEKKIQVAWFSLEGPGNISLSRIMTLNPIMAVPPDEVRVFPGITAGLYNSCNDAGGKIAIYLSGFDMLDFVRAWDRTAQDIYAEVIQTDNIAQLRNQGYRILVVDWDNSRIDMRFNALYLVNMLQELKREAIEAGNNEQFVILGESMGGVIARYALTYMESVFYQNRDIGPFFQDILDLNNVPYLATHQEIFELPANWNFLENMHNTRLLITLDAPHQGANIPIAVQKAYRHAMNIFGKYVGLGLQVSAKALNLFLDGQAAQQLLIYHVDTEHGFGFYKEYDRHGDASSFYGQLLEMGNYPQFAKVVLLSNGALNGQRQTNFFTSSPRDDNDRLLDANFDLYARVLWIKVPVFGGDIIMRTNPQGNGHVFQANAGWYGIRIKLKWFGIRIHIGYNSLVYETDYANVNSYCTQSGGFVGFATGQNPYQQTHHMDRRWLFDLFSWRITHDGAGCITFDSHVGWNGFLSANFDYSICSDGMYFNFVPVQSALDYGTLGVTPELGYDIQQNDDINTKLNNIPANVDVIAGWPSVDQTFGNRSHVGIRNDNINNLNGSSDTYFSCEAFNTDVRRGFVNLEIGDEELYLENNTLPWNASYQVEYDLHVNDRNPHYEYPSQGGLLEGIYSRQDDFIIDPGTGFATFIYDQANSPTGIGFNFTNPNGNFNQVDQPFEVCCLDFTQARSRRPPGKISKSKLLPESFLTVYPNPNNGNQAIIKYKFNSPGKVYVDVYNLGGQRLFTRSLPVVDARKETTTVLQFNRNTLGTGLHFIRLHNGKEVLSTKLLIVR
jgi:hypothetical protein